jgi:UDP-glucose 4-epimerase
MGMTKAIQERVFLSANVLNPQTRFICVRYGNVMASRGSVIPLFHHQMKMGGPITVTVADMTRFLLTLNQAVDTVYAAMELAEPGEIIVPNAPSVTISNLAQAMVKGTNIKVEVIGIRPAEKIHEIMVSEEESIHTVKKNNYYAIKSMLPELNNGKSIVRALDGEFSSEHNILDLESTRELLISNNLLPGMNIPKEAGEFLA